MKGFVTFLLAFAILLLLSTYYIQVYKSEKALVAEQVMNKMVNVKSVVKKAALEGGKEGWERYAREHAKEFCAFCAPQCIPSATCNKLLCDRCFRLSEALNAVKKGAEEKVEEVEVGFADFEVKVEGEVEGVVREAENREGYALEGVVIKRAEIIINSKKVNIGKKAVMEGVYLAINGSAP